MDTAVKIADSLDGESAADLGPWRLALVAGGSPGEVEAGIAQVGAPAGEPVEVYSVGAGGGHRGALLAGGGTTELVSATGTASADVPVAFLFPGLGDHYLDMARDLYRDLAVFRDELDRCATLLTPELGVDIRTAMFSADGRQPTSPAIDLRAMLGRGTASESAEEQRLNRTELAQPALFAVEYSLARQWAAFGVLPDVMIGYSLGEYVAACLAGVLSLEDSLTLVARRAKLIEASTPGAMLAVLLPEQAVTPLVTEGVSLSAVNGPEFCVVAGESAAVAALATRLKADGVVTRPVRATHAFHSAMIAPLAGAVTELAEGLTLNPPRVPYISNVTGRPITDAEATDPAYFARHLTSPVRFADGLDAIGGGHVLVEAGPGQTLSSLAATTRDAGLIVASMRHQMESRSDTGVLLKALARVWGAGAAVEHGAVRELTPASVETVTAATTRELTDTERRVRAQWARLLPGEDHPVDVSFFELGGNSLLATRLSLRFAREFDVDLPLRRIYETSTVTRMAAAIDALRAGTGDLPVGAATDGAATDARPRYELPNGLKVHQQNEAETQHFYEDIFDHRTYAKHGIVIPDGATVVDVGGNIGLFTLFAHYEAKNVRTFTFEPAPQMFELLSRNVAEHGVNANLFNIGISDEETEARFTFYPRSTGMSSFHADETEEKHNLRTIIANQQKAGTGDAADEIGDALEELIDVRFEAVEFTARLRPLSAVIAEQGIERIDLIKIDVQKCEQQVVDGITDEDWAKIQQVVLEAHDTDGRVGHLVELLRGKGFTVLAEQDELYAGTDIHNIYAVRG